MITYEMCTAGIWITKKFGIQIMEICPIIKWSFIKVMVCTTDDLNNIFFVHYTDGGLKNRVILYFPEHGVMHSWIMDKKSFIQMPDNSLLFKPWSEVQTNYSIIQVMA